MSSAQFKLDMFEGPLDLLLHLISKHKLNIHDIEISLLLEQYLEYMHQLDHEDLEDAADFLEMAARLIYIKTVSLLPQDEEAVELKKELEGRLIEYSQCKLLAKELGRVYAGGDIFVRKPVVIPVDKTYTREHDPQVLLEAYFGLSEKARNEKPINAKIFQPIVSYKVVSVGSKIVYVLKKLYTVGVCDLSHIYDGMETKSERVATFLAILELTKSGRICLNDDNTQIFFSEKSRKRKKHLDNPEDTSSADVLPAEDIAEEIPLQQESAEDSETEQIQAQQMPRDSELDCDEADGQAEENSVITEPAEELAAVQEQTEALQAELPVQIDDTDETEEIEQASQKPVQDKMCETESPVEDIPVFVPDDVVYTPSEAVKTNMPKGENRPAAERVRESSALIYKPVAVERIVAQKLAQEQIVPRENEPVPEQDTAPVNSESEQALPDNAQGCRFKPNYWNRLRRYWGNVSVGDDAAGNYWRYGKS